MSAPLTTYILPGFAEGNWHTKRLQKVLGSYGYREAEDATKADIVITHSAGCFFLPNTDHNKLMILINPPYWPGKPMVVSVVQKIVRDFRGAVSRHHVSFWARKTAWNWVYIVLNILRVLRIARFVRRQNFHEALREKRVAIIRNDNDPWFMPDAEKHLPPNECFSFYQLPGEHEDCWPYPEEHAALIHTIIRDNARL